MNKKTLAFIIFLLLVSAKVNLCTDINKIKSQLKDAKWIKIGLKEDVKYKPESEEIKLFVEGYSLVIFSGEKHASIDLARGFDNFTLGEVNDYNIKSVEKKNNNYCIELWVNEYWGGRPDGSGMYGAARGDETRSFWIEIDKDLNEKSFKYKVITSEILGVSDEK